MLDLHSTCNNIIQKLHTNLNKCKQNNRTKIYPRDLDRKCICFYFIDDFNQFHEIQTLDCWFIEFRIITVSWRITIRINYHKRFLTNRALNLYIIEFPYVRLTVSG